VTTGITVLAVAACGGGSRQDANEPEGQFPVDVVTAKFPTHQRLAETTDLQLGVKNVGRDTIPNLAITIFIDPDAQGSFMVRSDQPGLENPSRPVWILENKFPKLAGETKTAGAETATTNTFAFGPLKAGETKQIVWKVTAVQGGTYTINYQVAAGLGGKAKAVTPGGGKPNGKFAATITTKPPKARVNSAGKVTIKG
jgi:hypothetical protein